MQHFLRILLCGLVLAGTAQAALADAGVPLQRIAAEAITGIDAGASNEEKDNGLPVFRPRHLVDELRWTAWCGAGRGEQAVGHRVRLELGTVHYVSQLELLNGDLRSPKKLAEGIQTKTLLLRWEGGERSFPLARNQTEPQVLELPGPTAMRWIELEVQEIYPGGGHGPCFTEVALLEPKDLLALQPEMLEEIKGLVAQLRQPEAAAAAATRLQAIGPPAAPWVVAALKEGDLQVTVQAVRILAAIREPSYAPLLEQTYRQSSAPELRREILTALGTLQAVSSVPFLVEVSRSDDREVARQALLAMADFGDGRTIQPFLRAVLEDDEEVARIAIRHLGSFGVKAYQALLPALSSPSRKVRERATWALGRIDHPAARQALLRQLQSGMLDLAVAGLRGLGEHDSEENLRIVALNVHHEQPEIRAAVADALGGFRSSEEAAGYLRELAEDDDAGVRQRALASLIRLMPGSEEVLLGLIRDAAAVRLDDALQAAGTLRGRDGVRLQIKLLGDRRPAVQEQALRLLDAQGPAGLDGLIRAMGDGDPRIRFVASRRVSELGERGLPMLMRNATTAEDPAIRQACFKAITQIGLPAAREAVAAGLADPVPEVRREALAAAARLPWTGYAAALPRLIEQESGSAHQQAVEVAGETRLREAVPILLRQLEGKHPNSIRIIWALGRIGDPQALPALAAKARAPEAFTRQVAVTALGGLPGEQPMRLLMEAMLDPDPMVRQAAEKALSGSGGR